jgi:hypothetical protein
MAIAILSSQISTYLVSGDLVVMEIQIWPTTNQRPLFWVMEGMVMGIRPIVSSLAYFLGVGGRKNLALHEKDAK